MLQNVIVQKYGGSSVADAAALQQVAAAVVARQRLGHAMLVVVSAMGQTTETLLQQAYSVCAAPPQRELDMLVTAGERISMALLSMAIAALGAEAVSFTGSQSGIITDEQHQGARILEVRPARLEAALAAGKIVICAGYQGVSLGREITTLGRGGSDTTAVALAAALQASVCEIYSDVDGVYSADPHVCAQARLLRQVPYTLMHAMAGAGARVLNTAAVAFAQRAGITLLAQRSCSVGTAVETVTDSAGGPRATRIDAVSPWPSTMVVVGAPAAVYLTPQAPAATHNMATLRTALSTLGATCMWQLPEALLFNCAEMGQAATQVAALAQQHGFHSAATGVVSVLGVAQLTAARWQAALSALTATLALPSVPRLLQYDNTLALLVPPVQTPRIGCALHALLNP